MKLTALEISNLMKNELPLFIGGLPRSGTSILYLSLMKQLSFKPKNFVDDGLGTESKIFRDPYATYSTSNSNMFGYQLSGSNSRVISYMLGDKKYYSQFLESTQWIQKFQKILVGRRIYQVLSGQLDFKLLKVTACKAALNDHLIRIFFYYAKLARGMDRIIEKTPHNICYLPEIKQTFPNAKFIFNVRHPVDVFSSYKARLKGELKRGIEKDKIRWLKISSKEFCHIYTRYVKLAFKEKASNPSRLMLVKYENLTSNSSAELKRVFDFVGEIVQPEEEELIFRKATEKETERRTFELSAHVPIITNKKNWQDFLSEDEARFIEGKLSKLMLDLGYERYT